MRPNPIARPLRLEQPPASPLAAAPAPNDVSDALSYDAWIRGDWVRTSQLPGHAVDPAEEPPGTS